MKKIVTAIFIALFANVTVLSQELCSIDDFVKLHNLMKGCSDLTEKAKSNYEKARPFIVEIAQKYGLSIYEYHYVNGNLGNGEMSSYGCYLYKNCKLKKSPTGQLTFTPTKGGVSCVIGEGSDYNVYNNNSYNQIIKMLEKRCGKTLYKLVEDGEPTYFYSDGNLCFIVVRPSFIRIFEMTDDFREAMKQ